MPQEILHHVDLGLVDGAFQSLYTYQGCEFTTFYYGTDANERFESEMENLRLAGVPVDDIKIVHGH